MAESLLTVKSDKIGYPIEQHAVLIDRLFQPKICLNDNSLIFEQPGAKAFAPPRYAGPRGKQLVNR
jgi:hypothetical protein